MDRYDRISFLAYVKTPMSRENIELLYDANNVKFEKCELYGDFVQSLLLLVFNTYMGAENTNLENQFKHFEWCWNKNIKNFEEEGIFFNNKKLYNYFLAFVFEMFYSVETDADEKGMLRAWNDIFNYNSIKTNSDVDMMIEIYQIFEQSLKKYEKKGF